MYDVNLINYYGEDKLKELLKNLPKIKKCFMARKARSTSVDVNVVEYMILDALDNYIVYKLDTNYKDLDRNAILNYRDFLYGEYEKDKGVCVESILFKKENASRLFKDEQNLAITHTKYQISLECRRILTKLSNNEDLTLNESLKLATFLELRIGDERVKNACERYYQYLIRKGNKRHFTENEFFVKFTSYLAAKELEISNSTIYVSDIKLDGTKFDKYNGGGSYGTTGLIVLNSEWINKQNPISTADLIHTVGHEMKHKRQADDLKNGIISAMAFETARDYLFRRHLSSSSYDEYHTNYRNQEIELEAEQFGWKFASDILEKYDKTQYDEIKNATTQSIVNQYRHAYAEKRDNQSARMPKDTFNVNFLDKVIQAHPEELKRYPILQTIYNESGQRKSFIELCKMQAKVSKGSSSSMNDIYHEYYCEIFKHGYLNDKDLSTLTEEECIITLNTICSVIIKECNDLRKSIRILFSKNKANFEYINASRIKKIQYLMDYLKNNREFLNQLQESNPNIGSSLYLVDQNVSYVQDSIRRNEDLKETLIYEELLGIERMELYGHRKVS